MGDQAIELNPGLIVIGGLAETGFRDWYIDHIRQGFEERAPSFYVLTIRRTLQPPALTGR